MTFSQNSGRCSQCYTESDLVVGQTKVGTLGFCGPVCLNKYRDKTAIDIVFDAPSPTNKGIVSISPEVRELVKLVDSLKRLDYYSTMTYTRQKRITLERIREICKKIKIEIDSLNQDSILRAEDDLKLSVEEVIKQYNWTLLNLDNLINTDVNKTKRLIKRNIATLEKEYPELKDLF